jgi:hypothetical protein
LSKLGALAVVALGLLLVHQIPVALAAAAVRIISVFSKHLTLQVL